MKAKLGHKLYQDITEIVDDMEYMIDELKELLSKNDLHSAQDTALELIWKAEEVDRKIGELRKAQEKG